MRAGWGGHSPGEGYDSATTTSANTFITFISDRAGSERSNGRRIWERYFETDI